MYLLDANTLIDAKRDYFQFRRVPEFWTWLVYQGEIGNIKIPVETYEEFKEAKGQDGRRDELAEWAADNSVKEALLFDEEADPDLVSKVTYEGYGQDTTDDELATIGRDPFLISYALTDIENRTVVSTEVSKPSRKRANRQVPDVCSDFGIRCVNNFQLLNELDFTTGWK